MGWTDVSTGVPIISQHDKSKSVHSRNDAPGSRTATADDSRPRCALEPKKEAKVEPPALYQCSFQAEPVKWQSASKIDLAPPKTNNKKASSAPNESTRVQVAVPVFCALGAGHRAAQQLSQTFIINSLGQYQTFLEDQQEKINLNLPAIDEKLWRFVCERENLRVHQPHKEQQRNQLDVDGLE